MLYRLWTRSHRVLHGWVGWTRSHFTQEYCPDGWDELDHTEYYTGGHYAGSACFEDSSQLVAASCYGVKWTAIKTDGSHKSVTASILVTDR